MAHQIGLKVDHGSVGTDLASTMLKALMGDSRDEAYYAQTRSQIMNDEVSRREREQNILRIKADEARLLGEEARKARDMELDEAAATQMVQVGVDIQGNPIVKPAAAVEAPEPVVLESGGRGMPEHLVPLATPAAEMPVPVEIGAIDETGRRGVLGDTGFLGVQRGVPGELSFPPPPPAMLDPVIGVPPDLAQPPPPRPPVVGGVADNPIVGQGKPLIDLASLFGGGPTEAPVPVLPEGYLPPYQAYDDIPPRAEPGMVPMESLPEPPVPVEPPAPVADTAVQKIDAVKTAATAPMPAAPDTLTQPEATVATAAATSPSGKPEPTPVQPLPTSELTIKGADDGKADTADTVQTAKAGPLPRAAVDAMVRALMVGEGTPEGKMQAVQRLLGTLGATYNPQFGQEGQEALTENIASLRQGGTALGRESVLGTPAAIEYATKTGDIKTTMIGERAYTLTKDPATGKTTATLVAGQPPPDKVNPYGDSAEGAMRLGIEELLTAKPDPKTWDDAEKLRYSQMYEGLYDAKVQVGADGTVVVSGGNPPEGVLPGNAGYKAGGFKAGSVPPPTGGQPGAIAPPVEGQAAPPTTDGVKTNKAGRKLRADSYPSYGGYLVEGEAPPAPTKQTVEGEDVSILKPAERTKEATEQVGKQANYTRQALEPAAYFLKLKKGDVKVTVLQDMLSKMGEDTPVEGFLKRYTLSDDEREYFRNVVEIVKDMSHKDSGADVTKSDLVTYRGLYELPLDPTDKDLALLKRTIRNTLRGAREGFNGAVPSEQLRTWDREAGRLGVDLDAEEEVAPIGASEEYSEDDITATMKANNMTREQVLDALAKKKGSAQ